MRQFTALNLRKLSILRILTILSILTKTCPSRHSLPDLQGALPSFLEKVVSKSNSPEDADILILGTMAVISACLPHIFGVYADRTVYPNIFLFVTVKASSGKGRLALCRYIVEPIHDRLREINEAEVIEYKHKLAEYNAAGKKKVDMEKPEEPPMRMLFIPANSSATAVYQVLNDNGGTGLMFETEGDTSPTHSAPTTATTPTASARRSTTRPSPTSAARTANM